MVSMRLGCSPRGRARQTGQDEFPGPRDLVNLGLRAESGKAFGWWAGRARRCKASASKCFGWRRH